MPRQPRFPQLPPALRAEQDSWSRPGQAKVRHRPDAVGHIYLRPDLRPPHRLLSKHHCSACQWGPAGDNSRLINSGRFRLTPSCCTLLRLHYLHLGF